MYKLIKTYDMKIEELFAQAEKVIKLVALLLQTFPDHDLNSAYKLAIMAGLQDAYQKGHTDTMKDILEEDIRNKI